MKIRCLALVALLLTGIHFEARAALDPQASDKLKNRPVRDFQAETLDGKKFSFASVRGKPVMFNFFTSWCPVCSYATDDLIKLAPELKSQGFQLYGILADAVETPDTVAEATKTLAANPLPYPVLLMKASMKKIFSYEGFPATYFVDKDGRFSTTLLGHAPIDQVRLVASLTTGGALTEPTSDVHHWPWEKNAFGAFFPTEWKAWHPLFVHFPIALLILEAILVAMLFRKKEQNLILFSNWVLALATLSLIPVLFSGFHDSGFNLGPGSQVLNGIKDRFTNFWRLESTVSLHFLLALALLAITGARLLWRTLAGDQAFQGRQKFGFAALTVLGLWVLFAAGQVGGGISHS
ncbi:MAG: TlpA family protein disulfide reductase [Deltaproteobacteria bacterium]|nr:TlpA family protein disulfide reductase [Deltaproteobacteria bacterium]